MAEKENALPANIQALADQAMISLLPKLSADRYKGAFEKFRKWMSESNLSEIDENVVLAYFKGPLGTLAPSTWWQTYSMLKSQICLNLKIDIGRYYKVQLLLKRASEGYQTKKSKVLLKSHIDTFIRDAPDDQFLLVKVNINFISYIHFFNVNFLLGCSYCGYLWGLSEG